MHVGHHTGTTDFRGRYKSENHKTRTKITTTTTKIPQPQLQLYETEDVAHRPSHVFVYNAFSLPFLQQ